MTDKRFQQLHSVDHLNEGFFIQHWINNLINTYFFLLLRFVLVSLQFFFFSSVVVR